MFKGPSRPLQLITFHLVYGVVHKSSCPFSYQQDDMTVKHRAMDPFTLDFTIHQI